MPSADENVIVKITKRRKDDNIKIINLNNSKTLEKTEPITEKHENNTLDIDNTDIFLDKEITETTNDKNSNLNNHDNSLNNDLKAIDIIGDSEDYLDEINKKTILVNDISTKITTENEEYYKDSDSVSESDSETDDTQHYISIITVSDYIHMPKVEVKSPFEYWLYNLALIQNCNNEIPIFPLENIDENFRYKSFAKQIMKREWGVDKKNIKTIKHIFTKNNVHFYLGLIKSKRVVSPIPNILNTIDKQNYCWRDYLIMINSKFKKPKTRPYSLELPPNMSNKYFIKLVHTNLMKKTIKCSLDIIFKLVNEIR